METGLAVNNSAMQMEMFPALIGGKRPMRRGPRRKTKDLHELMRQQLALFSQILETSDDELVDEWSVEEIEKLHVFLLERSIEVLADTRTSNASIWETLEWVCANPIEPEQFGFSFRLCCLVCGYDDDRLRDSLIFETRHLHGIAA